MTRRFMQENREQILRDCTFKDQERQIFDLLCKGYCDADISDKVYLSERTVTRRVKDIRDKIETAVKQSAGSYTLG